MKSMGFKFDGTAFYKRNGKITQWISVNCAMSDFCYYHGEHWTDSEGNILNELGESAKKGDIILREYKSGFPVQKFGYKRIEAKKDGN